MKPAMALAIVLASAVALSGQQPGTSPTFDVASIRPSAPGAPRRPPRIIPGRVEVSGTTLKDLIRTAYSRFAFDSRDIAGGPPWMDAERFDIVATTARQLQDFTPTGLPTELIAMLRRLIEDRFRVRMHDERREGDVYALTFAAKDRRTAAGLRSVPEACAAAAKELLGGTPPPPRSSGPPPCSFGLSPGTFIATGVTIAMFSNVLSGTVGRPVVDRTELAGSFDIELNFDPASAAKGPPGAPLGPSPTDDTKPSIFTAIQEQLGLRLEPARGPIDVLVIDQAERPVAN
jgi:uncharacterized protein (TIGR03435 family)